MTSTFGEQYVRNRSHSAKWEGQDVFGSVRLDFSAPTVFSIDCVFGKAERQGVLVKLRRRKGRVAGIEGERFVLWDYSPFPVEVEMLAKRPPFEVGIWNVWKGPYGATTAWMGNGAMRVAERDETRVVLECNAGPQPVTFTDLRVTVSWPAPVTVDLVLPKGAETGTQ